MKIWKRDFDWKRKDYLLDRDIFRPEEEKISGLHNQIRTQQNSDEPDEDQISALKNELKKLEDKLEDYRSLINFPVICQCNERNNVAIHRQFATIRNSIPFSSGKKILMYALLFCALLSFVQLIILISFYGENLFRTIDMFWGITTRYPAELYIITILICTAGTVWIFLSQVSNYKLTAEVKVCPACEKEYFTTPCPREPNKTMSWEFDGKFRPKGPLKPVKDLWSPAVSSSQGNDIKAETLDEVEKRIKLLEAYEKGEIDLDGMDL